MKIAVVALGKIGLPLAVQFASKGHEVVGVDVNATVVDLVNAGTEPFPGEAHLQEKLSSTVADGRLRATTDYGDAVPGADAVVLVVPLFVDDEARPDFGWMDAATRSLAEHLTPTAAPYDVDRLRADFPALSLTVHGKPLVYLDNGASAQKPKAVIDAVTHAYSNEYANVHRGLHFLSNAATDAVCTTTPPPSEVAATVSARWERRTTCSQTVLNASERTASASARATSAALLSP